MASDPKELYGRVSEADLVSYRGTRVNSLQNWKNRVQVVDKLYRGDWTEVFPDESVLTEYPHVQNLVQVGIDESGRLASEAVAAVICPPAKDTTTGKRKATIRENIADTYWDENRGEDLVPRLAMDLAGTGVCFVLSTVEDDCEYPVFERIDPRFCYPTVVNGKLVDLLVVETLNWRVAATMFPGLKLDQDPTIHDKTVEILHYYSKKECVQAVMVGSQTAEPGVHVTRRWDPKGVMPVAWAQLDSFDGQFRGMFDQITGSLQTKNRLIKLILEYMDELVYAPFVYKGILNPEEQPGPGARFIVDPSVEGAGVTRVQPAGSSPEVFSLLEFLDREQRGGVGYPAARQGEVSQSIASASFVASTQGQLTTTIKNIQRLVAKLRAELNRIAFHQDENFLDFDKMLTIPIGEKTSYTPSKDIAGVYKNRVVYGAGAGLDRLQADNRIMQLLAARIISRDDARSQIDFINSPEDVERQVDLEQVQDILLQKFLTEADSNTILQIIAYQSDGDDFATAVQKVAQAQQEQAAPAAAPAEGAAPPAEAGPQNPELEAQALASGGQPVQPKFAPPPTAEIFAGGTPL